MPLNFVKSRSCFFKLRNRYPQAYHLWRVSGHLACIQLTLLGIFCCLVHAVRAHILPRNIASAHVYFCAGSLESVAQSLIATYLPRAWSSQLAESRF